MHVFVTGGTGTIGSAVVAELIANGHTVLALARSDASEQALKTAGAEVLRGELASLDVLRAGAAQTDGVISLAFSRDYSSADALRKASPRRTPRSPRWERRSSEATGRSSRSPARPGCPAAPPPKPTRCRPTDRSVPAAAQCWRYWIWPRAGCAAPPSACRARFTIRARAASPVC